MSDKGIHAVRAHLAKLPPSSTLTIAERRAQYDRAERVFPTPPDVKVEMVAAPTRPAEWLTPPGVRADAVVLYLHGGGYVIGSPRPHRHLAAAPAPRPTIHPRPPARTPGPPMSGCSARASRRRAWWSPATPPAGASPWPRC